VFSSLARRIARHPRITVGIWVVIAALAFMVAMVGVGGASLFDRVATGEPAVPGSQSQHAQDLIAAAGQESDQSITLLVSGVDPASPQVAAVMAGASRSLLAVYFPAAAANFGARFRGLCSHAPPV
jgi:RND superfamily putative drug exporter